MTATETISTAATAPALVFTAAAARRVKVIAAAEGKSEAMLRLMVSGGGCSGFQYSFDLAEAVNDDDRVFETEGAKLVIDEMSLDLLSGSEVDFVEDLMGAAFKIRNPHATATCGCGSSFAL